MLDLRLIAADVLKLRRRRGMLAISLLLTLGLMAVAFAVMAIQHGGNPLKYGPAGGLENYREDIGVIALMGLVIGAIVGRHGRHPGHRVRRVPRPGRHRALAPGAVRLPR